MRLFSIINNIITVANFAKLRGFFCSISPVPSAQIGWYKIFQTLCTYTHFPSGEVINFNNLIIAIFEFVQSLVDHKKFANLLDNLLPELMYYLIIFMQITPDQIQLWTHYPNQFVEEDDQCFTYNVRISAQELLTVSGKARLPRLPG